MTDSIETRLRAWGAWKGQLDELLQTQPGSQLHDERVLITGTRVRLSVPERIVGRVQAHYEANPNSARIEKLVREMQPLWQQLITARYVTQTSGRVMSDASVAALVGMGRHRCIQELNQAIGWISGRF